MKTTLVQIKFKIVFVFILFSAIIPAQEDSTHHCFYEENSFTLGVNMSFDLDKEHFLLGSRFYYNIKEHICFGPEISWTPNLTDKQNIEINFVLHYIFDVGKIGLYPVSGVSYVYEDEKNHTQQLLGAIGGIGLHRNFKKITLFAEYTYSFYKLNHSNKASAGLMYMF